MSDENTADIDVSAKKLTDWKNEPSAKDLKQDLMDSQSSHTEQATKIEGWLNNLNVEGAAKVPPVKGRSSVVPKLIRKQAEWRYASLSEPFLSTDDVFKIEPIAWSDRKAAQQNQIVLNNQFNTKIDKIKFVDDYVRSAVDEGTVIVRTGWEFEEEEYEAEEPVVELTEDMASGELHEELMVLKQEDPMRYEEEVDEEIKQAHEASLEDGVPYRAEVIGFETVTKTRTIRNQPSVEVCHYKDVVIDPTCFGDMSKAQFVIYKFESSLSELKRDGKYQNLDAINIQTNSILGEPDSGPDNRGSFNFSDKPRQKFTVHEYWGFWDIDDSGVVQPIVAAWVGDVLIRMEMNPFPDKKPPFIAIPYLPVRRSSYGEPDGALLEDNQKIQGAVVRGMIDIMGKSANGQTGIRRDALDVTNRRKYEQGRDYEFNANVDPRQAIYMHTYPEIPQSAQYMMQFQNTDAESMTGVKAFSQEGMSGASLGETATGARGAMDAASKRELNILRRLARGMVQIGRKIIAMNGEFLDETEVVRITNEEFVEVRRDDLAGHFDLRLTITTAEEDNAKAQELAFMLQTMGNNMDVEMSKMILSDIARLRKMPDLAKRIESFEPQPDPMQQKIQELEIAKLEAEIAKIQSETMGNQAGAQLDQAKARKESGDADKKSLDFVEQESGVQQERELEKLGEQARGNARLKVLDNRLKSDEKRKDALRSYLEKSAEPA